MGAGWKGELTLQCPLASTGLAVADLHILYYIRGLQILCGHVEKSLGELVMLLCLPGIQDAERLSHAPDTFTS